MRILAGGAVLVAALLVAGQAGAASDTPWREEPRQITFASDTRGFGFESRNEGEGDRMTGDFDLASASFALDFASPPGEGGELHLETSWVALVEFRDSDGDGMYGLHDEVVRRIHIADLDSTFLTTPLVGGGHMGIASYAIPPNETDDPLAIDDGLATPDGSFRLLFQVVPRATTIDSGILLPTEVGVATEVTDFPFQASGTRLGLELVHTSAAGTDLAVAGGATGLDAGKYELDFELGPQVLAGGIAVDAEQSQLMTGPQVAMLLVTWPRSDDLRHEGTYSVQKADPPSFSEVLDLPPGNPWLYAAGLAGVVVALGVPTIRRLRET